MFGLVQLPVHVLLPLLKVAAGANLGCFRPQVHLDCPPHPPLQGPMPQRNAGMQRSVISACRMVRFVWVPHHHLQGQSQGCRCRWRKWGLPDKRRTLLGDPGLQCSIGPPHLALPPGCSAACQTHRPWSAGWAGWSLHKPAPGRQGAQINIECVRKATPARARHNKCNATWRMALKGQSCGTPGLCELEVCWGIRRGPACCSAHRAPVGGAHVCFAGWLPPAEQQIGVVAGMGRCGR